MYYDEKLKRWVDPAAPESSEETVAGPPPTGPQAPVQALAPSGSAQPDRSEPGSSVDVLTAPPPSFRKKRGARGAPAKTSTAALSGALMLPSMPRGPGDQEPTRVSDNGTDSGTDGVDAPVALDGGAAGDSGVGMESASGGKDQGQGETADPLSGLGFAVFTPLKSVPTENDEGDGSGGDGTSAAGGGVDEWLEFKPPEPAPDSDDGGSDDDGADNPGGDGSGAAGGGSGVPGMGTLPAALPGLFDTPAADGWMDGGDDIAGLSGGDGWSGPGGGGGEPGGVDDFTAGMAFSAPPGMDLGFLPHGEDAEELSEDPAGEAEPAPTAYWGGGSDSPVTAEAEAEHAPEFEPQSVAAADSTTGGAGSPDASQDDTGREEDADSAIAAARAAQTARLAAQIARLKRAGGSADGDVPSDSDESGEQPPPVSQNADDDDDESEFDP